MYPGFVLKDGGTPFNVPAIVYADTTLGSVTKDQVISMVADMSANLTRHQPPKELCRVLVVVWQNDVSEIRFDLHLHYGPHADDPKHQYGPQVDFWTVSVTGDRVTNEGLACGATIIVAGIEELHRRHNWPKDYLEDRPELPTMPHGNLATDWPK